MGAFVKIFLTFLCPVGDVIYAFISGLSHPSLYPFGEVKSKEAILNWAWFPFCSQCYILSVMIVKVKTDGQGL